MTDKRTYCFRFDCDADKDVIDGLDQRFNRTEFIRSLIREYLRREETLLNMDDESPYYD